MISRADVIRHLCLVQRTSVKQNLCTMHRKLPQNAEMELHDRIRNARIRAGYSSAADAARRLGVPYGTYSGHENGQRGVKREDVKKYARVFGVSALWLETGLEPHIDGKDSIEILGEVGKSPETIINWYSDKDYPVTYLPRLMNEDVSALLVTGKYIRSFAQENYLLFFQSRYESRFDLYYGRICVCILDDESACLRMPQEGTQSGLYNLEFPNEDTIRNAKLHRISPVLFIITNTGYDIAYAENVAFAPNLGSRMLEEGEVGAPVKP